MKRTVVALALVVGIGIALAGCSSSDKKTDASASSTAAPATGASGAYSGDKGSKFCQLGADFSSRFSNLSSSLSAGVDKAKSEITTLKSVISEAKAAAPASVKSDVETLATAFDQFFSQAQAANFDPQALASAGSKLVTSNVQTAAQHLQAYGQQVCGLDTSGSTP